MKVLVLAEEALAASLVMLFAGAGIKGWSTGDLDEAVSLASVYDYDAVVMSVDRSGAGWVKRLRASGAPQPVLLLSKDVSPEGRAEMLYAGADAVLERPVHKVEVVAVLTVLIRRSQGITGESVEVGPGRFLMGEKSLTVDARKVRLTPKEADVLELLVRRRDNLVTRDAILSHLYGGMDEPEMKIIDVFICKLRKKLRAALGGEYIDTVWGRGYALRFHPLAERPSAVGFSPFAGRRGRSLLSQRGRILEAIAKNGHGMTIASAGAAAGLELQTARNAVSSALSAGLLHRGGSRGLGIYTLTAEAREWLNEAGYRPEADGAAEAEPMGEYQAA